MNPVFLWAIRILVLVLGLFLPFVTLIYKVSMIGLVVALEIWFIQKNKSNGRLDLVGFYIIGAIIGYLYIMIF